MPIVILIIVIFFGILQIRLFFKLFTMADNVASILKILEDEKKIKKLKEQNQSL
jgi:hypothetical protein